MKNRIELDNELRDFIGSSNVYFQPPESIKLKYPCIIYHLRDINAEYADDYNYKNMKSYELTIICRDPDNDYVEDILKTFKYIRFDRHFVADGLNHYAFVLFY